jgi:gliding motility-associated-like protein
MRNLLLIIFLLSLIRIQAQFVLPYSKNNICLDKTKPVSPAGQTARPGKNMVVHDFDGNGFDDVMQVDTANGGGVSRVLMYKNNAGVFTEMTIDIIPGFSKFNSADAGDFDGDSDLDIVVAYQDSLRFYSNLGAMNFSYTNGQPFDPAAIYKNIPCYVKAAELNGDTKCDLAILTSLTGPPGFVLLGLRSNSPGQNSLTVVQDCSLSISTGTNAFKLVDTVNITIGNFDNITSPFAANDIILADKRVKNILTVLKNNSPIGGNLAFSTQTLNTSVVIPVGTPTINIIKALSIDIDNDGPNDLVALCRANTASTTLQGFAFFNGSTSNFSTFALPGTLGDYQLLAVVNSPTAEIFMPVDFTLVDINNDGKKDIVGINKDFLVALLYNPANPQKIPYDIQSLIVVSITGLNLNAEEIGFGNYDSNNRMDIFFKSWRSIGGGITSVIPNFSSRLVSNNGSFSICPGASVSFSAVSSPSPFPTPEQYAWYTKPTDAFSGNGNPYTTSLPGFYYPQLTFPFPSSLGTCSISTQLASDIVTVTLKPLPTFSVSDPNPIVCPLQSATLSVSGVNTLNYLWLNGVNLISTGSTVTTPTLNGPFVVGIVGSDPVSGCSNSTTVVFNTYTIAQIPLQASKNPVCLGDSSLLFYTGLASTYSWSTGKTDSAIYVVPTVPSDYSVTIYDDHNCKLTQSINVRVDNNCPKELKVYNAVTINGDSNNDNWILDNIDKYPKNSVSIYNRWGERIFVASPYDNKENVWPGKQNNLIPSTYFYILNLGNGSDLIKGWIELIKN